MIPLMIYLLSAGLVVLGALAFIAALRIPGRIRVLIACGMACVPIAAGAYIFHSSKLKISDWDRLIRSATLKMEQMGQGIQRNRQSEKEIMMLLERK